jgi:glucokinase
MVTGTVIGVDLGGTKITAAAVGDGAILRTHTRKVPSEAAEEAVVAEVLGAIAEVFDDSVAGIGCGVPSVVELDTGIVLEVENIPSWRRVPLRGILEERFDVPAVVNNDANTFAVGEHLFGRGRAFRHMVGITLGTGLGAGLIIDGRLYCGRTCGAGELGSIPYKDATVEDYCAGRFFLRELGSAGEIVYGRARAGELEAIDAFRRFGHELAGAMMIVACALDPEAVIMGGSISRGFDLFEAAMRERLADFGYRHVTDRLVIERSTLEDAAVLGAAALYLDASRGEAVR